MKKLMLIVVALVLFLGTCMGLKGHFERVIAGKEQELVYYNSDDRNSCEYAMGIIINNNTIPFFGSSELSATALSHPKDMFHEGNSDFNMILIGRGNTQSLHHAITLGAIAGDIPGKKVVLNLSPQWFTATHLTSEVYASRFSERMYAGFLKNSDISYDTKVRVAERLETLLAADEAQRKRAKKYAEIYLEHTLNPIVHVEMGLYDMFMEMKQEYLLQEKSRDLIKNEEEQVIAEDIDWESWMAKAERSGEKACTNNKFYIYDEYFDTYIKDVLEERKDNSIDSSYVESLEYEDLRLFLKVCGETGIEPLVINVPVNGYWYDWIGWPKDDRQEYYQKIRDICEEYQVPIADFSDKEYEPYFLKDVMHMGWKGWVYVNEAVYRFYKEIL